MMTHLLRLLPKQKPIKHTFTIQSNIKLYIYGRYIAWRIFFSRPHTTLKIDRFLWKIPNCKAVHKKLGHYTAFYSINFDGQAFVLHKLSIAWL